MKPERELADILRENIKFSGQTGDYVIHGAIEKLIEWRDNYSTQNVEALKKLTEMLLAFQRLQKKGFKPSLDAIFNLANDIHFDLCKPTSETTTTQKK